MIPIVQGGITEFAFAIQEFSKYDNKLLKTLGAKKIDEIKFQEAKFYLGKDSFDNNGNFTKIGKNRLKKIMFPLGLSINSTVEQLGKRLAFLSKNPMIIDNLERLRETVFWLRENPRRPYSKNGFWSLVIKKTLDEWSDEGLINSLSTNKKLEKCFSLINIPLD